MRIDPTRYTGRPAEKRTPAEEAIYDKLEELGIPFDRVDHDHADTMEDCLLIESTLGGKICKNLFLCNRQQTAFYLLMMPGGKPFKTKFLSAQLGCARLSFADAGHMAQYLRTIPGSVSALELLFDTETPCSWSSTGNCWQRTRSAVTPDCPPPRCAWLGRICCGMYQRWATSPPTSTCRWRHKPKQK